MSDRVSTAQFERTTPRLVEPDTEENLQRQFHDNGWTDYLPIVLPTEKRVEETRWFDLQFCENLAHSLTMTKLVLQDLLHR